MKDYGYAQSELCWGAAGQMTEAVIRQICQGIRAIGGSRVRMGVQLGGWDDLDMAVNIAVECGLKPLLCIINNPQFGYNGTPAGYGAMCKAIALRYGPAGSGKVSEYEIMNEENSSLNAPFVGDAAGFVPYLQQGYTAIKSVHTSSEVICGGCIPTPDTFIPFIGVATDPIDWLKGIYAAGGKGFFDSVGEHLYFDTSPNPSTVDVQWTFLPGMRAVMDANGDTDKKIRITEVGVPSVSADVKTFVQQRDRAKAIVDMLIANADALKLGVWFWYNFRCYTGGDGVGGTFGVVNNDLTHVEPLYSFMATIEGAPADPMDIIPPSAPTGLRVTSAGVASWNPATDDVGVTVYRIYDNATNTMLCHTAQTGQTSMLIPNTSAGTPYTVYTTALDAAGNESLPSATAGFTTDAPSGSQQTISADFSTSPTVPPDFIQLGWGFKIVGGVALPNVPTTPGDWYTIGPSVRELASPDHYCEISQDAASAYGDRYAMAGCRVSLDGSRGVFAFISGGSQDDAVQIVTIVDGVVTTQNAMNATPLLPGEWLRITPSGSTYTVERYVNGVASELVTWKDLDGVYPVPTNRRAAPAWRHKLVGGHYYPPNGITKIKAADVRPVTPSGSGGSDAWTFAVVKPKRIGLVAATGLWEIALK